VLRRLSPHPHDVRLAIEPILHRLQDGLVLPAGNTPIGAVTQLVPMLTARLNNESRPDGQAYDSQ
jgi:hypothetical protein